MEGREHYLTYVIGIQCIKWCRGEYGKRGHRSVPRLALTALRREYGEYNYYYNRIEVDIVKHLVKRKGKYIGLNLEQYVDTIIHEYQHYLQDWSHMKVIGFNKEGEYISDNLYEDLAIKVAERDTPCCVEYLTNLLKLQK